jgi:enamine deaminase RidA (YjgF/YER057c/UK114 family)
VRSELLGGRKPALNTVVVNQLLRPQALIEIEVVARQGGAEGALNRGTARENGAVVYLPSMLPVGENGLLIAPGDLAGQTRAIYRQVARVLESLQLGPDNIVKTVDYLTPAALGDYKHTADIRRQYLAPAFPAATGIIMPRVAHPDALIQIDIIASRQPRTIINPGWSSYDKLTYSPGVRSAKQLFISGHAALDPHTGRSVHEADIVAQADYIYGKILDVIAAAGGSPEQLVKTVEYVTPAGLPRYREVANVRTRIMRTPLPASTGVVCERLLRPEYLLEVDSFAIIE